MGKIRGADVGKVRGRLVKKVRKNKERKVQQIWGEEVTGNEWRESRCREGK